MPATEVGLLVPSSSETRDGPRRGGPPRPRQGRVALTPRRHRPARSGPALAPALLALCGLLPLCGCGPDSPRTGAGRVIELTAVPWGAGAIRLSWSGPLPPASGLVIERRGDGEAWEVLGPAPVGAEEFTDGVGEARRRLHYRLAAPGPGGHAAYSTIATAVPGIRGRPLFGWIDVGAYVGDPAYASTAEAIQAAINTLAERHDGPHVLYFPDGEYAVDRTLYVEGKPGAQFVGESRGGVVLRWTGPAGRGPDDVQVLIHADGNRDATWRNIVWDAGCVDAALGCFVVAFDHSFCGRRGSPEYSRECDEFAYLRPDVGLADSGSAHVDSTFRNAYIGLRIGHYQVQDSEITVRGSTFRDNFIGVGLEDQNALDEWFWDCRFEANHVGLTNDVSFVRRTFDPGYRPGRCRGERERRCLSFSSGGSSPDCADGDTCDYFKRLGGDFDVHRGRFAGNEAADMSIRPGGEYTIRESWSTGSGRFLDVPLRTGSAFVASLIDNRVGQFDPDDRYGGHAVYNRGPGPLLLVDNEFHGSPLQRERRQAPIFAESFAGTDVLALGNGYTVDVAAPAGEGSGPYDFGGGAHRLRNFADRRIEARPVEPPELPRPDDPLDGATVYTVADAAAAQAVIRAAAADPGAAVVHFPVGVHTIGRTLAIPPDRAFVILGDGPWTRLSFGGSGPGPLLALDAAGGHDVTVRDIQLYGAGMRIENLEGTGADVLLRQLRVAEAAAASVVLDDVDRVRVDLVDFMAGGNLDAAGLLLRAGSRLPAPGGATGPGVAVWTGNLGGNRWDFDVIGDSGGVRLLISSTYMEDSRHHLRLRGRPGGGQVTVHGGKLAPIVPLEAGAGQAELAAATATIDAQGFRGELGLIGSVMFIQSAGEPCCSDPRAVAHGARLRVQAAPGARVRALGNIVDSGDPESAGREYQLGPESGFLRLGGKVRDGGRTRAHPDIRDGAGGAVESVANQPSLEGAALAALTRDVERAFALLREMKPPPVSRADGDSVGRRIELDEVFIWAPGGYGLWLGGGAACEVDADCAEGGRCDRRDLPRGVPGTCRI